ncbi:Os10g0486916, partial [Oryza sativa Japonica Group]
MTCGAYVFGRFQLSSNLQSCLILRQCPLIFSSTKKLVPFCLCIICLASSFLQELLVGQRVLEGLLLVFPIRPRRLPSGRTTRRLLLGSRLLCRRRRLLDLRLLLDHHHHSPCSPP